MLNELGYERNAAVSLNRGVRLKSLVGVVLMVLLTAIVVKGILFQLAAYVLPLAMMATPSSRQTFLPLLKRCSPPLLLLFLALALPSMWAWEQGRPVLWADLLKWFWKLGVFPVAFALLIVKSRLGVPSRNAWILLAGAWVASTGIYDAVLFAADHGVVSLNRWPRFDGVASNPNPFGLACALGAVAGVVNLLSSAQRNRVRRGVMSFLLLLCICGVLLSGSRGALLVFLLCSGLACLIATRTRSMSRYLVLFFVGVLLLFGVAELLDVRVLGRLADTLNFHEARLRIWAYYLGHADHNLWGVGLIDPREVLSPPMDLMPHNFLLELLVMGGVVAMMLGAVLVSYVLWQGWCLRLPEMVLFLGAALFAFVDMSLFDSIPMEAALMIGLSLFHAAKMEKGPLSAGVSSG